MRNPIEPGSQHTVKCARSLHLCISTFRRNDSVNQIINHRIGNAGKIAAARQVGRVRMPVVAHFHTRRGGDGEASCHNVKVKIFHPLLKLSGVDGFDPRINAKQQKVCLKSGDDPFERRRIV